MKCGKCDAEHDEMFIHAQCHPNTSLEAILNAHGILTLQCPLCNAEVLSVELAQSSIDKLKAVGII